MMNQRFNSIGYNDQTALVPYQPEDAVSRHSFSSRVSAAASRNENSKAIEYLKISSQQKENVRDFILNSRQILKSQIIIDDMNKEAERLKDYIIMEQQKLEEVKQQLEIERQQFQNDQNDEKALFEETSKQLREKRYEKKKLIKEIEWLNSKIA